MANSTGATVKAGDIVRSTSTGKYYKVMADYGDGRANCIRVEKDSMGRFMALADLRTMRTLRTDKLILVEA